MPPRTLFLSLFSHARKIHEFLLKLWISCLWLVYLYSIFGQVVEISCHHGAMLSSSSMAVNSVHTAVISSSQPSSPLGLLLPLYPPSAASPQNNTTRGWVGNKDGHGDAVVDRYPARLRRRRGRQEQRRSTSPGLAHASLSS